MSDRMIELAERCEQATGSDRGLDGDIAVALGLVPEGYTIYARKRAEFLPPERPTLEPFWIAIAFTASLDAALTLVPEGWAWSVGRFGSPATYRCNAWMMPPPFEIGADIRTGATPALALCAAALRARAASPPHNRGDE